MPVTGTRGLERLRERAGWSELTMKGRRRGGAVSGRYAVVASRAAQGTMAAAR
jgi:hypothetical protein